MSETIYCGGGKKQNETWIKATINPDKIKDFIEAYEGNKFVKLNVNIKSEPDKYGKDVSISVDTWKPDETKVGKTINETKEETDGLPF